MQPVIEVNELRLHYLTRIGERIKAVDGVSFELPQGQILGIAGESGCGKTTLVNGCMGLNIPPLYYSSGDIRIGGKSLVGMSVEENRRDILGKKVAMIPQGALNSLNPTRKIKDMAVDMIQSHNGTTNRQEIYQRLHQRFKTIGMEADQVLNAYPVQLPAGMKQRVVIGISTLLDPKVVIADEPTSALDVSTQKSVIQMLFDLLDHNIISSMIFITHELPLLRHVADVIAVMYAGEFVEVGRTEEVIFAPKHPYTTALMGAMLSAEPGQKSRKPVSIEGAPPDLKHQLRGCRFAERCPSARKACFTERQSIRPLGERQIRCQYVQ
jgi:peptide/nickel transport system ATP-binding protein